MGSISKFIERMDYYCRVASVGYDWARRWNVWDGGDTDCSALTITCLREAGFDTGSAETTHNLSANLTARGWIRMYPDLSTARPGDILLNDANHVAVVLWGNGWGATIAQASIGDTGDVYGNQPGDQTGWETNETAIYDYPWDCILRWSGDYEGYSYDETEDDMQPTDVWGYKNESINGTADAYALLTMTRNDVSWLTGKISDLESQLATLTKTLNAINKTVKNIKVGGVNVSAVAKAVNDDAAKRMQS